MKGYTFHGIIEKEEDVYCAVCLELDIATEADTLEGAKENLREAVEGYVESVVRVFLRREVIDNLKALLKVEKEGLQSLPIERVSIQRRLKA
jgi:predicted RNase H-like HicB family nuclease